MDSFGEGLRARGDERPDRRPDSHRIAVALLLLALAIPAAAAESIGIRTLHDAEDIGTAPVMRWRAHEWTRFAEGVALVAAIYPLDARISDAFARNHHRLTDRSLNAVTHLGGGYGTDLTVLMAGAGYLTHDQRMMNTGIDAFEASVFADGIITSGVKRVAGRARPNAELGPHSFHPFNSAYESFPSGHATNAFSIATAIATRYDDVPWVAPVAYTLATSVAVARVNSHVHWPSDVVAGALIGRGMAKAVVARHVTVVPGRRAVAVNVSW
jgi:membrane-associated phospholipid phosphatase